MTMLKIVLLTLAVAAVRCEPRCNSMDRLVVKSQWVKAYGHGTNREEFGISLFNALFEIDPSTKEMFGRVRGDNVYSAEFKAHVTRLMGGIDMCVSFLDEEDTLNAQLAHLSNQHAPRKVTAEQFKNFARALNQVLPDRIGRCYNQDAWHGCFEVILKGIGAYLQPVQLPEVGDAPGAAPASPVQLPEIPAKQLPEDSAVQLPEDPVKEPKSETK